MNFTTKSVALSAASAVVAAALASSALADGMPKRGAIKSAAPPPETRACSLSANVALASEYVFRGISQTAEGPAIQGGFDATCGILYAGVWASNLDFGTSAGETIANIEIDLYAGIKPKTGPITWDLGVIYYAYPNAFDPGADLNMVEIKVGGSAEIWKGGTLGATVFYSPDYTGELGPVWTVETAFSQALPTVGMFSPTFSALIGYNAGDDATYTSAVTGFGDDHYLYWNVGLTFGFLEKWSVDFRYWDTDLPSNGSIFACGTATLQCDERFTATLKFTY